MRRNARALPFKNCAACGQQFKKNYKFSASQWAGVRFCSRSCGSWNRGLTKNGDARIAQIAVKLTGRAGRPSWNRGLTKDSDVRVAKIARNLTGRSGPRANESQLAALRAGRVLALSAEAIGRRAATLSKMYTGRKNPAHSKRLKRLFREQPDKHPNAILAKKTRGLGFTKIERLTAGWFTEIGVGAQYNYRIGTKWTDFAIPELGLVVECDGSYWHQDKDADARRDEYLMRRGWRVLHLPERAILDDPISTRAILQDFLCSAKIGDAA